MKVLICYNAEYKRSPGWSAEGHCFMIIANDISQDRLTQESLEGAIKEIQGLFVNRGQIQPDEIDALKVVFRSVTRLDE